MSRSIRKETSSLALGIVGRFGGISAGFVVAALNAASAASREVVVLRVLSAGILCPRARASLPKHNWARPYESLRSETVTMLQKASRHIVPPAMPGHVP